MRRREGGTEPLAIASGTRTRSEICRQIEPRGSKPTLTWKLAPSAQHMAESLWLSGETFFPSIRLRLSLRRLIIKKGMTGKPEAYRYVLRRRRKPGRDPGSLKFEMCTHRAGFTVSAN